MSRSLKSQMGKYASIEGLSTMNVEHENAPSNVSIFSRSGIAAVSQLTENVRKSVDAVTELLLRTVVEESRTRYLADASLTLFAAQDEAATFDTLLHLFVPKLADAISIFSTDGDLVDCRAVAHADPSKEIFVQTLARCFTREAAKNVDCLNRVFRQGQAFDLSGQTIPSVFASLSNDDEVFEALAALDLHWVEGWPLTVQGRILGAVFLFGSSMRHQSEMADEETLQSLAHYASLAIDNVRLHEHARQRIRARERLMAIAAHDLRNFLSLALLSLSTIEGHGDNFNGSSVTPRLLLIRKGLHRMQRIVEDLLDFSSLEGGHLSIVPAKHDVGVLVNDALEAFREAAAEKNVHLVARHCANDVHVECDVFRLLQVLSNLLGNALKFTPAAGTITLAVVDNAQEVEFSVADTGCGIPASELPGIFQSYGRSAHKRAGSGVGLGLSIAKGIIESHGGKIWVESKLNEGTTFYFCVPKKLRASTGNGRV